MKIIKQTAAYWEWLTISWRIIHLGKNPKKGGRPPKERRFRNRKARGARSKLMEPNWLIWVLLLSCKIITTGKRRSVYKAKYVKASWEVSISDESIQPTWLIDEKVIKRRVWIWARPWMAPTTNEAMAISSKKDVSAKPAIINKGLIFWIVRRTYNLHHDRGAATEGNQAWKGAAPNLILKDTIRRVTKKVFKYPPIKSAARINKIEASVWVKKYFRAASLVNLYFSLIIKGMNAKVFNSSPTQDIK